MPEALLAVGVIVVAFAVACSICDLTCKGLFYIIERLGY